MFDAEPEGWEQATLGKIITLEYGRALPEASRLDGDVPVYGSNGPVGSHAEHLVEDRGIVVGRKGTAGSVHVTSGAFWPIDTTYYVRPRREVDFDWLAATLRHADLGSLNEATGVPGLNRENAYRRPVLLPPLDEQRRIAEVLRSVDEAIAATEAVLSAASAVRQSALDALMRVLVEADGRDHVLSEVAEVRTGLAKNKNADGRHVQLPYLRVANVQDGWFDLSEMQEIAVEANKVERYSLKDGDVLLTEGGDYDKLGRGGVWKAQVHPCLHQNHVFCVRSDQTRLLPEFLALVTQSYLGRAYFLSCAKRTTNLASINSSQLKALPVPLPDLEKQGAVVTEIGCIDLLIEWEEEKLRSLQRLRTSQAADLLSGRVRVPA